MKRPPFERPARAPQFDDGKRRRSRPPVDDDGVDIVFAPTTDERALDRVAELLDQLFHGKRAVLPMKATQYRGRRGFIYFARAGKRIKIGFSENVAKRLRGLQTACADEIMLLGKMPGTLDDERALHHRFRKLRTTGEWFRAHVSLLRFVARNAR